MLDGPGWGGMQEAFSLSLSEVWGLQESKGNKMSLLELELHVVLA